MDFTGQRLLLAAKEAGAGALLAALAQRWHLGRSSAVIASPVAASYFEKLDLERITDDLTDEALASLVAEMKLDRVVVGAGAGASIEKRVLRVAQSMELPVDAFVDHYWNLWQRFADPDTARPWAYIPDRIHVPAEACARRLVMAGFPDQRLAVFDHPLLNHGINSRDERLGREHRLRLGIPEHAVTALFVSEHLFEPDPKWNWDQAHAEDYAELLKRLLTHSSRDDLARPLVILLRPHPSEPKTRWDALCQSVSGSVWRNVADLGKDKLFSMADLAFGLNSMLLLEALSAGLPIYSLHTRASPKDAWLSSIRGEIAELADERACDALINKACQMKGEPL